MAEKKSSQPQQIGFDTWAQLTRDQIERVTALAGELAQVESAAYDQARELLDYSASLAAEWRRLVLAQTKKAADMWAAA
jgi:hypothetical protein